MDEDDRQPTADARSEDRASAVPSPVTADITGTGHPLGRRLGWRTLATEYPFESPWFDLRQDTVALPDGKTTKYAYVEHPGFVCIVALTGQGEILLIRSYRYPVDDWVWEVPAGGFGGPDTRTMDGEALARAELVQETGHRIAGEVECVGWFWSGIGNNRCRATIYFTSEVEVAGRPSPDPTERIEVHPTPAERALEMARAGTMADGHSALALLRCESRVRRLLSGRRP